MDIRDLVLFGLRATHTRVLRCIDDISEEEARRSPGNNLAPIVWQVGHLALADGGFVQRAGATSPVPASFLELFKTGTGGPADYPSLNEVRAAFDQAQRQLEVAARGSDLSRAVESRNYGSIGEMLTFGCYHRGYHIGKMTTLRALLGKPRLFG